MKLLAAFCCLSLISVSYGASTGMEILKPLLIMCVTEEGGSDSDLEMLLKAQEPTSPAGLCIVTCVHEKIGIVSKDNIVA